MKYHITKCCRVKCMFAHSFKQKLDELWKSVSGRGLLWKGTDDWPAVMATYLIKNSSLICHFFKQLSYASFRILWFFVQCFVFMHFLCVSWGISLYFSLVWTGWKGGVHFWKRDVSVTKMIPWGGGKNESILLKVVNKKRWLSTRWNPISLTF